MAIVGRRQTPGSDPGFHEHQAATKPFPAIGRGRTKASSSSNGSSSDDDAAQPHAVLPTTRSGSLGASCESEFRGVVTLPPPAGLGTTSDLKKKKNRYVLLTCLSFCAAVVSLRVITSLIRCSTSSSSFVVRCCWLVDTDSTCIYHRLAFEDVGYCSHADFVDDGGE